jgi:hypothetical protein
VLTPKGKALWPVLATLRQWGDEWILGAGNEPVEMVHTACGRHAGAHLVCDHCGEALQRRELRMVPGPGYDESVPLLD